MSLPAAIALCSNLARSLVVARIEEQRVVGVLERRIEIRRPARYAVRVGQLRELAFIAADQDRVGHHRVAVSQHHAPLRADRQNGADEMLIHPHAAGHAVHDDAETLLRHAQIPFRCRMSDVRAQIKEQPACPGRRIVGWAKARPSYTPVFPTLARAVPTHGLRVGKIALALSASLPTRQAILPTLQCYTLLSPELRTDHSEGAFGIIEARRLPVRHARERSHRRKTARLQECEHVRLRIGEIDEERRVDALDRVRQERAGDPIALRNQRSDVRDHATVAAQAEADDAIS